MSALRLALVLPLVGLLCSCSNEQSNSLAAKYGNILEIEEIESMFDLSEPMTKRVEPFKVEAGLIVRWVASTKHKTVGEETITMFEIEIRPGGLEKLTSLRESASMNNPVDVEGLGEKAHAYTVNPGTHVVRFAKNDLMVSVSVMAGMMDGLGYANNISPAQAIEFAFEVSDRIK